MPIKYLKKSPKTSSTDDVKTHELVQGILKDLETSKENGCIELTKKFDKYEGEIIVSKERIEEIKKTLDQKTKDDVQFSYDRVRKFAEAQLKNYGKNFEVELREGGCSSAREAFCSRLLAEACLIRRRGPCHLGLG